MTCVDGFEMRMQVKLPASCSAQLLGSLSQLTYIHVEVRGNLCCPGLLSLAVPQKMNCYVVGWSGHGDEWVCLVAPERRVPESKLGLFFSQTFSHSVSSSRC